MRIAFLSRIIAAHGIRGGMEQHGETLCSGLAARGHEVVIITTAHPDGISEEAGATGRTLYVPAPSGRYSAAWIRASWDALKGEHAQHPFDVMISQSAGAQAHIARARNLLNLSTVVILHGTMGTDWLTRRANLRSARDLYRLARFLYELPGHIWRWRNVRQSVAHWIAVSHEVKAAWQREMKVADSRITVVPNGIDTARFEPDHQARAQTRRTLGISEQAPVLVAAGRLEAEKGFQIAIEVLRQLVQRFPETQLIIAGEGSYRQQLERRAIGLSANLRFLGHVPNERLPALLAAADIFLLPTLRYEGLPLILLEALSSGLPVLATEIGGIIDAIDNGRTGVLLPAGAVPAWTAAVEQLLRNARQRRAMGVLARQLAVARYSHSRMVETTERILLAAAGE